MAFDPPRTSVVFCCLGLLTLLINLGLWLRGQPSRSKVPIQTGAVHTWILADDDRVGGRPRVRSPDECRFHFAEFLHPIHSPRPAPAIDPSETKTPTKCLRLLVVVIFNHPLYNHVPFLRRLYEPFFSTVVFYGKEESGEYDVRAAKQTPGQLGNFQHYIIAQATVEFPHYDGYLWLADDLVFNFKEALTFLDPRKLWLPAGYWGQGASPNIYDERKDWHWPLNKGLPALRSLYGCIPEIYRERSTRWFGGPDRVTRSVGDFGYIPRRFVEDFRILSYSLRYAHMEIVLPTSFYMMSNSTDDFQVVSQAPYSVQWLWGKKERRHAFEKLTSNTLIVHPVKLYKNPAKQRALLEKLDKDWNWTRRVSTIPWLHCK